MVSTIFIATQSERTFMWNKFLPEATEKYLKPNAQNNLQLTIDDFDSDKVDEFEKIWREHIQKTQTEACYQISSKTWDLLKPGCTVDKLKPYKKESYDRLVQEYITDITKKEIAAFHRGDNMEKISQIYSKKLEKILSLDIEETDFIDCEAQGFVMYESVDVLQEMRKDKLRSELTKRTVARLTNNLTNLIEKRTFQLAQLRHLHKIVNEKNKTFATLTEVEFTDADLKQIEEEETKRKEALAEKACRELLMESKKISKDKVKKKNKKNKNANQGKKLKSQAPEGKEIAPLLTASQSSNEAQTSNVFHSQIAALGRWDFAHKYVLHPRVKRWGTTKLEAIREFEDFDPKPQMKIKQYVNCNRSELEYMQKVHRLEGIEKILSIPEFCENYSFFYTYVGKDGLIKEGRTLYCTMKEGKTETQGFISVGIGKDQVIYHALFEPYEEENVTPADIIKRGYEFCENENDLNENWNLPSSYLFSILENDTIQMDVGKDPQSRVSFLFYPLNC